MRRRDTPEIFSTRSRNLLRQFAPSIWAVDGSRGPRERARAIAQTLLDQPRWLHPSYLYDSRGSRLFERICELPEYYLTRTEEAILDQGARGIIARAPVQSIVELGAGYSRKTMHLLREQSRQRGTGSYIAVDLSPTALRASRRIVRKHFPAIAFHGLQARYKEGLTSIKKDIPTLFVFLGSSIGNFSPSDFDSFFQLLSSRMGADDFFLLGVDRVKQSSIIQRAYDDSQKVTAEFILNVFNNINRLAGTNFDRSKMRYHCCYNNACQRVEMYAIAICSQKIDFPSLRTSFRWREGERILVEMSRKFDPVQLNKQLKLFHLNLLRHLTDSDKWFSLLLFKKGS